jgi:hypothetical protein
MLGWCNACLHAVNCGRTSAVGQCVLRQPECWAHALHADAKQAALYLRSAQYSAACFVAGLVARILVAAWHAAARGITVA